MLTIDHKEAVRNIIATVRRANAADWAYGSAWYLRAHHEAVRLADTYGLEVEQTAGIIAVLSPRLSWDANLYHAEVVCATGTTSGILGLSISKAERIYGGEPVASVIAPPTGSPRSGQKVRAFLANILDPLFSEDVCVDRHAFDVAYGEVTDDTKRGTLDRKGVYESVAAAYVAAANTLGLRPWQVQAVTWECWRRTKVYARPQHAALFQNKEN